MDLPVAPCALHGREKIFQEMRSGVQCGKGGCRGRAFTPVKDTAACVDWQLLRVQELRAPEDTAAQLDESVGRVPRTIQVRRQARFPRRLVSAGCTNPCSACQVDEVQVEMGADLAGMCRTGDTVEVTGILKLHKDHSVAKRAEGPSKGRAQQQSGVYTYYIEVSTRHICIRRGFRTRCGDERRPQRAPFDCLTVGVLQWCHIHMFHLGVCFRRLSGRGCLVGQASTTSWRKLSAPSALSRGPALATSLGSPTSHSASSTSCALTRRSAGGWRA